MARESSFTKYMVVGGVVVGGGLLYFGRKLWAGVEASREGTEKTVGKIVEKTAETLGKKKEEAVADAQKLMKEGVVQGEKFVGTVSGEAALLAAQAGWIAADVGSVNRIVRELIATAGDRARTAAVEAEAATKVRQILDAYREFEQKGHLTSVQLNKLVMIQLWNDARVKAGHSGKSVIPPAFIAEITRLLEVAGTKKAVLYPRDVVALTIMQAARLFNSVNRTQLVNEETEPLGLIELLDRNKWAAGEDKKTGRKMWWQLVSPVIAEKITAFMADVKKGRIAIYEKGFGKSEKISYTDFAKEYL